MNRIVAFILVFGLTASCQTPKDISAGEQPKSDTPKASGSENETYYLGEVQLLDCGPVIQISYGESKTICSPVNLDPKFRIDKLRLKLNYKVLDEKATTCSEFIAIEIKEVFAVR